MRRGFGLITAIIVLVAVATLMALMMSLSGSSIKSTVDIYLKEQAEILSRSATEYALLAISGHNNTLNCVESININYPQQTDPTHQIDMRIYYIGNGIVGCNNILDNGILTDESNLTVVIDTVVTVNTINTGISEPIRIHRRTTQKP